MPNTIRITSTTDSQEDVNKAAGVTGAAAAAVEDEPKTGAGGEGGPATHAQDDDDQPAGTGTETDDEADGGDGEGDEVSGADSGAAEGEQQTKPGKPTQGKEKGEGGVQKKIDKLTKRAANAERLATEEREAREEAEQELATLKGGGAAKPKPAAEDKGEDKAAATEVKVERPKRPIYTDYDDALKYEDAMDVYLEKLADYTYEMRRAKERTEQQAKEVETQQVKEQQEQKVALDAFAQRVTAFKEAFSDYDEVSEQADEDGVMVTGVMQRAIVESDYGPALGYYLAKNPDEAERIGKLSLARQAMEMGKLEDKVKQEYGEPTSASAKSKADAKPGQPKTQPASNSDEQKRNPDGTFAAADDKGTDKDKDKGTGVSPASPAAPTSQELKKISKAPTPISPTRGNSAPVAKDAAYFDKPGVSQKEYKDWRAKGGGRY